MTTPDDITTACPQCGAKHPWDPEQDSYLGADEVLAPGPAPDGAEVTRWVCRCGGTVAVGVLDRHGLTVYTPSECDL